MNLNKPVAILKVGGIKCDAEGCDWEDNTISSNDYKKFLNKPCPKCGANLLTQADYNTAKNLRKLTNYVNKPPLRWLINLTNELLGGSKRVNFRTEMNGSGEVKFKEVK